jgi:hypothetical protein
MAEIKAGGDLLKASYTCEFISYSHKKILLKYQEFNDFIFRSENPNGLVTIRKATIMKAICSRMGERPE